MAGSFASNRRPHHPCLLAVGCLLAGLAPVASHAQAWDGARCGTLAVSAGAQGGPPGHRHAADWRAILAGPAGEGTAGRLHAHAVASDGPPSLDALPALVAGALLVALDPERPHDCDLTHAFRQTALSLGTLPPGAQAGERWTGVEAHSHGNDLSVGAAMLHVANGAGGRMVVDVDGHAISSAGTDMTATPIARTWLRVSAPADRVAAVARGGALRPDDTIHIERLALAGDDALIEASGEVRPASRTGHLMVRARNMEALRDALPAADRERAGAAFLVLRLAAKRDDDGTLHWDVTWEDNLVTVNGVPLPVRF